MSDSWPMVPLGNVIRQRKEFVRIDDFATYKRCRVQLHAKGIVLRDIVEGQSLKTKEQQICRAGEFLVAEIDAKVGGFGIVPQELDGAIVSSHYFLFVVDEAALDGRFLGYFIQTPAFQDQVAAQGSTNYAAIRPQHVLDYRISLPPLPEQYRIVARIEELAADVGKARVLREEAVEEARALMKSARLSVFSEVDLQRRGKPLGEIATFLDGKRIPLNASQRAQRKPGHIPYYGASGIVDYINEWIFDETLLLVSEDGANIELRSKPIAFVINGKAWVNNHAHVLRLPEETTAYFLAHYVESLDVRPYWQGATRPKINKSTLESVVVPDLPLVEQRRIVAYLDRLQTQVDELTALQQATQAELDALLPAVLERAFRREL